MANHRLLPLYQALNSKLELQLVREDNRTKMVDLVNTTWVGLSGRSGE